MTRIIIFSCICLNFVCFSECFSLVEYSKDMPAGGGVSVKYKRPKGKKSIKYYEKNRESRLNEFFNEQFVASLLYDSLKYKEVTEGKASFWRFEGKAKWNNFHLEVSYYFGKNMTNNNFEEKGFQKGNPKFLVGIDWLTLGKVYDETKISFYAGTTFAANDSDIASSRNDTIIKLVTTKKIFLKFLLGLSGSLRLTGDPQNSTEVAIGSIRCFSAYVDWIVSPDIRWKLMANNYKIESYDDNISGPHLEDNIFVSTVNSYLYLGLMKGVEGVLGVGLQLDFNKGLNNNLDHIKVFDIPSLYGNSIFIGTKFFM